MSKNYNNNGSTSDSDSDMSIHDEIDEDHLDNFNKYKIASSIVNKAMKMVIEQTKASQKILNLAVLGDKILEDELNLIYNKKKKLKYGKGISMPTCLSINNIAAFNSPLLDNKVILVEGDVVKIEMGVHIDGFICLKTKTIYIEKENDLNKDKIKNLLKAIDVCEQTIKGKLKVDNKLSEISKIFGDISKKYGVSLITADTDNYDHIPGLFSYQLSRGFIDSYNEDNTEPSHKMIVNNKDLELNIKDDVFQTNDVMIIDIMMSTGSGKLYESEIPPSVYLRNSEIKYNLKLKASREILSEFTKKSDKYPCTFRLFDNNKNKIGLKECVKHKLLEPYNILSEKNGEFIAQSKFTVIIKFNKNHYL